MLGVEVGVDGCCADSLADSDSFSLGLEISRFRGDETDEFTDEFSLLGRFKFVTPTVPLTPGVIFNEIAGTESLGFE